MSAPVPSERRLGSPADRSPLPHSTGRVIQRPFRYGDREGYYEDFNRRFQTGDSAVKEEVDSTQVYKTLRLGRTVYGGGGITPDIVVEADTSGYTEYWGNLIRKGIINEFVVEYMDKNRAAHIGGIPPPRTALSMSMRPVPK